jgi:hypothetical protein
MPDLPHIIIWTFRRTGGTTLERMYRVLYGEDRVHGEPFNFDRIYGDISRVFATTHDGVALVNELRTRLTSPTVIKHCVEMASGEFNRALFAATTLIGFRHIVLFRINESKRLHSLAIARATKFWGQRNVEKHVEDAEAGRIPVDQIDTAYLLKTSDFGTRQLALIIRLLRSLNDPFVQIEMENFYSGKPFEVLARFVQISGKLGIKLESPEQKTRIKAIVRHGPQNSSRLLDLIPNKHELTEFLEARPEWSKYNVLLARMTSGTYPDDIRSPGTSSPTNPLSLQ